MAAGRSPRFAPCRRLRFGVLLLCLAPSMAVRGAGASRAAGALRASAGAHAGWSSSSVGDGCGGGAAIAAASRMDGPPMPWLPKAAVELASFWTWFMNADADWANGTADSASSRGLVPFLTQRMSWEVALQIMELAAQEEPWRIWAELPGTTWIARGFAGSRAAHFWRFQFFTVDNRLLCRFQAIRSDVEYDFNIAELRWDDRTSSALGQGDVRSHEGCCHVWISVNLREGMGHMAVFGATGTEQRSPGEATIGMLSFFPGSKSAVWQYQTMFRVDD